MENRLQPGREGGRDGVEWRREEETATRRATGEFFSPLCEDVTRRAVSSPFVLPNFEMEASKQRSEGGRRATPRGVTRSTTEAVFCGRREAGIWATIYQYYQQMPPSRLVVSPPPPP